MSYAELLACSNFSFQRGASHPFEMVKRAAQLGYQALAISDECTLAGIVRAHDAARDEKLKLIAVGSHSASRKATASCCWCLRRRPTRSCAS